MLENIYNLYVTNKILQIKELNTLLSSVNPKSLPCAAAKRFPWTKFPTMTEAGPTDVSAGVEVPQSCNNEPLFFIEWYFRPF